MVRAFFIAVCLVLLTPLLGSSQLLFGWTTPKADYLLILIEAILPFYVYLIVRYPDGRPTPRNPLTLSLLLFLGAIAVSARLGLDPFRSTWGTLEHTGGLVTLAHLVLLSLYVQLLFRLNSRYGDWFLLLLAGGSGLVSLYGLLELASGNHLLFPDPAYPHISATFGNPVFLAAYLVIPLFLCLFLLSGPRCARMRIVLSAIAACDLGCIVLSQSKAASIAVLLTVWVCLLVRFGRRLAVTAALVTALAAALAAVSMSPQLQKSLDFSSRVRLLIWQRAATGSKEHLIFGTGPENYYVIADKYYEPALYRYETRWLEKPYDVPLELLVTSGAAGLAAFAAVLLSALWILFKCRSRLPGSLWLAGALIAYESQNLTVFDTISANTMLFCLLALIAAQWSAPPKAFALAPRAAWLAAGLSAVAALSWMAAVSFPNHRYYLEVADGYWYGRSFDIQRAVRALESARALPIPLDPAELAAQYYTCARRLLEDSRETELKVPVLSGAIAAAQDAVHRLPRHAATYLRLSDLYLMQARLDSDEAAFSRSCQAADEASRLAANRPEVALMRVRLLLYRKERVQAERLVAEVRQSFPTSGEAMWQSALLSREAGRPGEAAQLAWRALLGGYVPYHRSEVEWLAAYYKDLGNREMLANIQFVIRLIGPALSPDTDKP